MLLWLLLATAFFFVLCIDFVFLRGMDMYQREDVMGGCSLPVGNIFIGIDVDVAVRDTDAWIFRVGYNITLLGKIVFLTNPIIT